MHLKCKDWKRFWRKKPVPKVPECPNYGNFGKVTQNPNFLKNCKWGTRRNFSKIAQKVALAWKAQQHSGAYVITLLLVCTYSAKNGNDFGEKTRLQKCPNGQVMAILARSPITRMFWKRAEGNFSKIVQKVAFAWKSQQHCGANGIIL